MTNPTAIPSIDELAQRTALALRDALKAEPLTCVAAMDTGEFATAGGKNDGSHGLHQPHLGPGAQPGPFFSASKLDLTPSRRYMVKHDRCNERLPGSP